MGFVYVLGGLSFKAIAFDAWFVLGLRDRLPPFNVSLRQRSFAGKSYFFMKEACAWTHKRLMFYCAFSEAFKNRVLPTRGHWGVENALHWRLDVSMNEDQCRLRVNHGAENFSRLRRIALNKLNRWEMTNPNGKIIKASTRLKQQSCGFSRKFLIEALLA
jgi:hypothetical protein